MAKSNHSDRKLKFQFTHLSLLISAKNLQTGHNLESAHLCLVTYKTFSIPDSADTDSNNSKSITGVYYCASQITGKALSCVTGVMFACT